MPAIEQVRQEIATIFTRAQKTTAAHKKCVQLLKKIETQPNFSKHFLQTILPILLVFKREPAIERIVQFIVNFIVDEEKYDQKFTSDIIRKLSKYSNAKDKAVRFRVCQIVSNIINSLPDDADFDDDLLDFIATTYVHRMQDKIPIVRMHAVNLLSRLQDVTDPEDEIVKEYIRLMANDSNKDVRKAVLENIAISKVTLPHIIERTRDSKDDVRQAAYEKLASQVPMKKLTIAQRISLLKHGLFDRNENVRKVCINMLCKEWLKQVDSSLIKLLECLDVECYKETCEQVLDVIFDNVKDKQIVDVKLDFENLTPESILYWRCKCDNMKKHGNETGLDENLMTVTDFCTLLIKYQAQEHKEFIARELLVLAKYLDYCDEVGRKNMYTLLSQMLITFTQPELYVKEIVQALTVVAPSNDILIGTILHAIDELRKAAVGYEQNDKAKEEVEAMKKKLKSLRKQIKQLEREKRQLVEDEEYTEAEYVKKKINAKNQEMEEIEEQMKIIESEEISMWIRALLIMAEMLENTAIDISHMLYLMDDVILKTWKSDNPFIKNICLKVLGQFCSLRKEFAIKYISHFIECLSNDGEDENVHETAIKCIFDIIMMHGFEIFKKSEEKQDKQQDSASNSDENPSITDCQIVDCLMNFFDCDESALRTATVEGFAKLLLTKKITYKLHTVISKQVLSLYNPMTENDERLRQCLSVFLPTYSFSYLENMENVANSVLETLRAVILAKKDSSLRKINLLHLSQFLIYLSDPANLKDSSAKEKAPEKEFHEKLAIELAYEILAAPKSKHANVFCKLFPEMTIYENNQKKIKTLRSLITDVKKKVLNKVAIKALEKFESILQELDKTPKEGLTREELEAIEEQKEQRVKDLTAIVDSSNEEEKPKKTTKKAKRTITKKKKVIETPKKSDDEFVEDSSPEKKISPEVKTQVRSRSSAKPKPRSRRKPSTKKETKETKKVSKKATKTKSRESSSEPEDEFYEKVHIKKDEEVLFQDSKKRTSDEENIDDLLISDSDEEKKIVKGRHSTQPTIEELQADLDELIDNFPVSDSESDDAEDSDYEE